MRLRRRAHVGFIRFFVRFIDICYMLRRGRGGKNFHDVLQNEKEYGRNAKDERSENILHYGKDSKKAR